MTYDSICQRGNRQPLHRVRRTDMKRRSRTRQVLKWVALVGCTVLASAFVFSIAWCPTWYTKDWCRGIGLSRGRVWVVWDRRSRFPWERALVEVRQNSSLGIAWWPHLLVNDKALGVQLFGRSASVPLWMPFLALALPTAFLWHRDRRPPKGHCQTCGYDLTGNVTGVCPECGAAA